ncbi:MAG: hypothetical protein FJW40_06655 [Acidobacteria bacterium]|nr:hypothetical protein [Acidobacteriota bacterium]
MSRNFPPAILAAFSLGAPALAQRGGNDWMTSAFDAQRSSWVRTDTKIYRENMAKPGFEFLWKHKVETAPRAGTGVTQPALLDFYIGYKGFRALGFYGGTSGKLVALDIDLARVEWEKTLSPAPSTPATAACPGGLTSGVARPTSTDYPNVPTTFGFGRGNPAKSGVGAPDEGAVTLRQTPAPPFRPTPPAKPGAAAAAAFNPFAPRVSWVLAVGGDGKLHSMWVSNGNTPDPAVPFVPAGAHAVGLVSYGGVSYVSTINGCGGAPDGVWALDMATKKVVNWKSAKPIAGSAGHAAGPDGTVYAAAGSELTALAAKTLEPLATFKTGGAEFNSSPVVFDYKGKNLIAAATTDGRLLLLDSAALGGAALDQSAVFSSGGHRVGTITSWQDPQGTRWVLASAGGSAAASAGFPASNGSVTNGAIAAWRVVDKNGVPSLEPAWTSRDLAAPLAPVVIGGVVFAASSRPAVLYAFDSATGKEFWNSGKTIVGNATGGLAAGGNRVYVATQDGTQWVFGFPIEH